jgi:uncharacterized protein
MRIYIYELSDDEKDLHYSHRDAWVQKTVAEAQESKLSKDPDFALEFRARRLQEVVFLNGELSLQLGLLCSRCANPFDQAIQSQFKYLFTRRPALNPTGSVGHAGHSTDDEDNANAAPDLEVLEKDYIELEDVLKEQIYLKIPVQPLCSESCKGVCPVCGQDRNVQPCQCHRIKNTALANALKNFRQ